MDEEHEMVEEFVHEQREKQHAMMESMRKMKYSMKELSRGSQRRKLQ